MKKKVLVSILTASMMVVSLAGCGDNRKSADTESAESATETAAEESTADAATEETSTEEATDASTEEASDETATAELFEGEYTIAEV